MPTASQYKIINGNIIRDNDSLKVQISIHDRPQECNDDIFQILNKADNVLFEKDRVSGYLMRVHAKTNRYSFFIVDNNTRNADVNAVLDMINLSVINRVNKEAYLYASEKSPVSLSDINSKSRRREVVFCRHLGISVCMKHFNSYLNESVIGGWYKKDRTSVYHACTNINNLYETDLQIKKIVDDVHKEVNTCLNNLLTEGKQENVLFPFYIDLY